MNDFFNTLIEKFNDILFEVLGLLLPPLILCMVLVEPLFYMKNFSWGSIRINDFMRVIENNSQFWLILFIIAVFYVVGNVIKVLSKLYYKLGKAIVDDTLYVILRYIYDKILCSIYNKILRPIYNKLIKRDAGSKQNSDGFKKLEEKPIFVIIYVFYKWLRDTLAFKIDNYGKDFGDLYTTLAIKISITLNNEQDKEEKWFLFYKKATIILNQNNISTLYYKFLSKYNSFRSIEFIFFCGIIYNIFFWHLNIDIKHYFIVLGVNLVCLISFHEKFKRYWKLCGDEVILGLEYYYKNMGGNEKGAK